MKIEKGSKIGIWWIIFGLAILALGIRGIYWNQSPGLHMSVPGLDISGNLVFGSYFILIGVLFMVETRKLIVDMHSLGFAVLIFSISCVSYDFFWKNDIEFHYFFQIEYLILVLVSTSINFLNSTSGVDNDGKWSIIKSNMKRALLVMTIPSFLALLVNELFFL